MIWTSIVTVTCHLLRSAIADKRLKDIVEPENMHEKQTAKHQRHEVIRHQEYLPLYWS